jgi:hypothetical protein
MMPPTDLMDSQCNQIGDIVRAGIVEVHHLELRRIRLQADLAQKYWDVANAIVAFSVLQMLAFLYSLGKPEFRKQVSSVLGLVKRAIAISSLLYIAGIALCYWAESTLRGSIDTHVSSILLCTMWIRIAIILIYTAAGIAVLNLGRAHGK